MLPLPNVFAIVPNIGKSVLDLTARMLPLAAEVRRIEEVSLVAVFQKVDSVLRNFVPT